MTVPGWLCPPKACRRIRALAAITASTTATETTRLTPVIMWRQRHWTGERDTSGTSRVGTISPYATRQTGLGAVYTRQRCVCLPVGDRGPVGQIAPKGSPSLTAEAHMQGCDIRQ